MQSGDVAGAALAIAEVVNADPGNAAAWQLAGMIRRRAGDNPGAVAALEQAIALGLSSAEVWNSLGLAREDSGDLVSAEAAFARAASAAATYTPGITNHARLLGRLGRHAEAEALLRAALERQPKAPDLLNALGVLLIEASRTDEAEGV